MIVARRFPYLWPLFFALLAGLPAAAQNVTRPTPEGLFAVEGVAVDATAESGTAARDRALAQGQALAWARLAARLAPAEDAGRLEGLSAVELEQVIRDIEVVNERTAATRYRADLSVRFRPEAVRSLMVGRGARFSDLIGPATLILPVWRAPGAPVPDPALDPAALPVPETAPAEPPALVPGPLPADPSALPLPPPGAEFLWDDPNPWRRAWESAQLPLTVVPMIVPLGDIADVADISVDAAVLGDPTAFPAIAGRYGAQNVAVLIATPVGGTPEMPAALEVTLVNHTAGVDLPESGALTVAAGPGMADAAALYAAAVEQAAAAIAENWKRANAFGAASAGSLQAVVAVERLEEWAEMRRRLEAVPIVTGAVPARLAIGEVRLTLKHRGDRRQLALALSRQGIVLDAPAPDAVEPLHRLRLVSAAPPL